MSEHGSYTARTEDLVVQELGDELLIYDRMSDVAHCLTEAAACVWRTCAGGATFDEITDALVEQAVVEAGGAGEAEAIAERALTELDEKGLLEQPGAGVSRRHALRRIAGIGAGALVAPLVVSATVPTAAEAFASPVHCGKAGKACLTASCGTSTSNNCCGPGVNGCPTGTVGGCYCNTSLSCTNCIASGGTINAGSKCAAGTCTTKGTANCCCCSGTCSATTTGKCA